jgi:Type II secretion system (T2SS), protein G
MFSRRNFVILIVTALAIGISVISIQTRAAGDLSPKEARKLIAKMAGINLPSDAVRVKSVSSLGSSAVVVAQVETAFRFVNENGKWRVAEIRTGDRNWEDVDSLVRALNMEKTSRVRAEMETIATALEAFKRERGAYVESKSEAQLIDFLSPRYLARVIRVDAWQRPYEYEGTRNSFVLRSTGPDGKPNTPDDITRTGPGQ